MCYWTVFTFISLYFEPECDIFFSSEPQVEDVTALEIEVRGACESLKVSLHPFAINIPGQLMVETAVKKKVKVK